MKTKKSVSFGTRVEQEDYLAATEDFYGWCPVCEEFTRECTEPDAEGYDCPDCGNNTVCGAENALLFGQICF